LPKLARNVERDGRTIKALKELGWRVLVVWECELDDEATLQQGPNAQERR
jgi:DNA mismatch endonuclease, patch repair protein